MNDLILAFEVLLSIYKDGAYSAIELNRKVVGVSNQAIVTRMVYGVLQKDVQLEYYLGKITSKRPSKTIAILLKLGLYCILYIDSMPKYAIVNNVVNICEKYGKRQLKGFVNATLKNFDVDKIDLPSDKVERLSVTASAPLWLVKKYVKQYGYDTSESFLSAPTFTKEHLRNNSKKLSLQGLKDKLDKQNIEYTQSEVGGLFVGNCGFVKGLCERGEATFQSMTSMLAVKAMEVKDGEKILDLCSAPGGKSILMSELASVEITACDIHEHRLDLIRAYANRMGASNIKILLNDACEYNENFVERFDKTLCDVPCSGLGVVGKKPDIYLNTSQEKINSLADTQYKILTNASKYTKKRIVYSTCTTLREENYNVVGKFVKENSEWQITSSNQYLPNGKGQDGFFIAVLERKYGK
ncbi:MAG: 16S rRNA (cytosine(967)-C(5))-methyltransferase RsmB [Clostridiales bacterium]|nr:16S rRNA (cytosine(967)-C(5))-methyltransferase RsmB [Clostridiales bacterium]